jgi:hypothetical protein
LRAKIIKNKKSVVKNYEKKSHYCCSVGAKKPLCSVEEEEAKWEELLQQGLSSQRIYDLV